MSEKAKHAKNEPELRFPEFEGEWEKTRVDKIGRVIRGASPRPKGDKRYYGGHIPRLMVEDVTRDGKFVYPKTDFLTDAGAKLSRPCKAGTLTIVCSGNVGVTSILAIDACIHDGFLALIELKSGISEEFLYAYFSRLQSKFDASATHGGVFINLTTQILKEFPISLPPKDKEQQKIASFLSAVDEKIAQLEKKKKLLEDYKKGCMQQLFSQALRFKDEDGNDYPDWEEKRLGDIAEVKTGSRDTQNRVKDGKYPFFVRSNNVEKIDSYSFNGEAILTSGDGVGVGKNIHYINGKFDYHQRVYAIFNFTNYLDGKYFFHFFKENFLRRVMRLSAKNSVDSVRMSMITDMRIPCPILDEQQKIADFLSALDDIITHATEQLEQIKTFKKGLLQKMFV